jgi:hypothetical protein
MVWVFTFQSEGLDHGKSCSLFAGSILASISKWASFLFCALCALESADGSVAFRAYCIVVSGGCIHTGVVGYGLWCWSSWEGAWLEVVFSVICVRGGVKYWVCRLGRHCRGCLD